MSQILEALNQLTRERRVDKELLFETLEIGLTSAIKKKYGNNAVVDVVVDEHDVAEFTLRKIGDANESHTILFHLDPLMLVRIQQVIRNLRHTFYSQVRPSQTARWRAPQR